MRRSIGFDEALCPRTAQFLLAQLAAAARRQSAGVRDRVDQWFLFRRNAL
jgi:hypothetical protein